MAAQAQRRDHRASRLATIAPLAAVVAASRGRRARVRVSILRSALKLGLRGARRGHGERRLERRYYAVGQAHSGLTGVHLAPGVYGTATGTPTGTSCAPEVVTTQSLPVPTGRIRMVSVEALISVRRLPHRVWHVNRENRPATPRPRPVHCADKISDPISPPMIGFTAVSRSTSFWEVHCHGFGFGSAAVAEATTTAASSDDRQALTSPTTSSFLIGRGFLLMSVSFGGPAASVRI